uniref:BHLH domain-containing protein n=1 Tax=Kalanchoe fedtschenkoi TaxID=63787 RepID=A0A7N0UHM8_KALFE
MEEGCCGGGEGGGPINLSASFDGGVEPSARSDFLTASLGLDDRMPFLRMLHALDPSITHSLLKKNPTETETQILPVDCCITHDTPELHSPVMSEGKNPTQVSPDGTLEERGELNSVSECRQDSSSQLSCGKMRKPRKHAKVVVENKKDVEKQRMTHIAIERNRRRQMSDYLSVLRSLLPPAYAERGDQASIVGGAIDYVKKLEQLLQSLQAQKRQRKVDEMRNRCCSNSMPLSPETSDGISTSTSSSTASLDEDCDMNSPLEKKADINIRVVQTHVNLHIGCDDMKQSELIKLLIALERLRLKILHLNITSIHKSSFYSLSLNVEDECKLRSTEEISSSIEQLLNSINIYNGRRSSVTKIEHMM